MRSKSLSPCPSSSTWQGSSRGRSRNPGQGAKCRSRLKAKDSTPTFSQISITGWHPIITRSGSAHQVSAQEYHNAKNIVTRAGDQPPNKEEQPTQDKAPNQARNATSSAPQGGTKAAELGEVHARSNATSQHKTRAHFIASSQ